MRAHTCMAAWVVGIICSILNPATGKEYRFDFEAADKIPAGIELRYGATMTNDPEEVISGSGSVIIDTRETEEAWNQFLETDPAVVRLPAGTAWEVTFDMSILGRDPQRRDMQFYFLLRSKSEESLREKKLDNWGNWYTGTTGEQRKLGFLFETGKVDDYFLIIGIYEQASQSLDNLLLRQIQWQQPPGYGAALKPRECVWTGPIRPELNPQLAAELQRCLVVVSNEGAGARAEAGKICDLLQPDYVDWQPLHNPPTNSIAAEYGVRTSISGWEYQELYAMEAPAVYTQRFKLFPGRGFSEGLWGQIFMDERWTKGGYFMCHNGDAWHGLQTGSILQRIDQYEGICQDNIGCAPWEKWDGYHTPGGGCFCAACTEGFRQWLTDHYSSEQLNDWGLEDLGSFRIAERVRTQGLAPQRLVHDPLVREYILFQFQSQLQAWADVRRQVNERATRLSWTMPCYGNQIGIQWGSPFALSLSPWCDVIQVEDLIDVGEMAPARELTFLLGRAAIGHNRPVWVRGPVHSYRKGKNDHEFSVAFWKSHLYEALACGGVRDLSLGQRFPGEELGCFLEDEQLMQAWMEYSQFCREHRPLFTERRQTVPTALFYNLSQAMWGRFSPFGLNDDQSFRELEITHRLLAKANLPHEIQLLGHPDVFDDSTALQTLTPKRYQRIVLCGSKCVSKRQEKALRRYVEAGGEVFVATKENELCDENLVKREPSNFMNRLPLFDQKLLDTIPSLFAGDIPPHVRIIGWKDTQKRWETAQLVRYATGLPTGSSPTEAFHLEWHQAFSPDSDVAWITPGTAAQILDATLEGESLSVEIPGLDTYGVLFVGDYATYQQDLKEVEQQVAADIETESRSGHGQDRAQLQGEHKVTECARASAGKYE